MDRGEWKRYALVGALVVVVLVVFAVLYGELPWWIDGARLRGLTALDQASILSSDRGDVLKMVAGAGALVALVYTARKHALDREGQVLDREGQVTDRYTRAIAQLASDKESERIGGIYALERIMIDSPRDHLTVVEVLAAFVRQQAPVVPTASPAGDPAAGGGGTGPGAEVRPDADVQAAMTVLARRPERSEELFRLDLRRTALAGLELPSEARLARVNFAYADLTGAHLYGATLTGAHLYGATLTGAHLFGATLTGAQLIEATLTGADLRGATLTEANLYKAMLTEADLVGATLTEANLGGAMLTRTNLHGATLTEADLVAATLTDANLYEATLTRADLVGATLTGAYLVGATLTEADLGAATLTEARLHVTTLTGALNLVASQLADAGIDGFTRLDEGLANDTWVRARIEACNNWSGLGPVPPATPDPSQGQQ